MCLILGFETPEKDWPISMKILAVALNDNCITTKQFLPPVTSHIWLSKQFLLPSMTARKRADAQKF